MIDFGLSKKISDNKEPKFPIEQIYLKKNLKLTGTPIYASCNNHLGWENSFKKDDLESLMYILIHLLTSHLPWQDIQVTSGDNYYTIFKRKSTCTVEELCKNCPLEFMDIMKYIKELNNDETPNYQRIIQKLESIAES